jgi:hypothetical protein
LKIEEEIEKEKKITNCRCQNRAFVATRTP